MAASKKNSDKFKIQLSDWIFVDTDFNQKYRTYFPINRLLLRHNCIDKISPTAAIMLIMCIDHAYNVSRTCFELDPNVLYTCRERVENVLTQLQENQLLTFSKIKKERKERKERKETLSSSNELDPPLTGSLDLNGLEEPPKSPPLKFDHENKLAHDQIAGAWNYFCVSKGLPGIKAWTDKRKKKAEKLTEKYTKQEIEQALENLGSSEFCLGKNDRGWKAGIDFFLSEEKFVKILEGEYGKSANKQTPVEADPFDGKIAGV